ncbi:MAG: aminotransferase class I/II-fold pyridoxal phosphate-dependent enzyme [Oscillibacter sp.]|nr:aminotransferase class I/II-fold pyridoxal phosphate-dependent enzyme [Oscillibacter sp.]
MKTYAQLSPAQRAEEYAKLQQEYDAYKAKDLRLNMARGKPSRTHLDSVSGILHLMQRTEDCFSDGIDVRNYGELAGLPAARRLFADLLGCRPEQVFAAGNSSLQLMYDTVSKGYTHGMLHSPRPWCKEETIKWLCPCPGYDRHFKITETFGFELVSIPMNADGPDMDAVEAAVKDPAVKGIWCVPKYSNPGGEIYSDAVIRRMAALKPAAPDFTILWDNAYCVHEFEGDFVPFPDMLALCAEAGRPDMPIVFSSTSKMTLPGAGIACFACSEDNLAYLMKLLEVQTIGYDKVNQQRHVLFLKDKAHILELMKQHAAVLGPKFQAVADTLDQGLRGLDIASWTHPKGGYFVSLNAMPGTARRALALCAGAGVAMTGAGAAFPYGKDPQDSNIRIAPSLPPVEELKEAISVLCVCLKLAALEKLGMD